MTEPHPTHETIATMLSDWLEAASPGWSQLHQPVVDYGAEIERHQASAAWLSAHGFHSYAKDYHRAVANLQVRQRADALGITTTTRPRPERIVIHGPGGEQRVIELPSVPADDGEPEAL